MSIDVVNVLRYDELEEIVLCAGSYGGMVVTGVAEQMPERIKQLIYLDAFVPEDGQSAGDLVGPDVMGFMEQIAAQYGDGWRVSHNPPDIDRRTDFLLKAAQDPLYTGNPKAKHIKRTYVQFTEKVDDDFMTPVIKDTAAWVKKAGSYYLEMPFEHWPFLSKPREVAALLLELGGH